MSSSARMADDGHLEHERVLGMTLRTRLALAVAALTLTGFAAFGLLTYNRYSSAKYDALTRQLQASVDDANRSLHPNDKDAGPGGKGNPRPGESLGRVYAEERDSTGVRTLSKDNGFADLSETAPRLPATIVPGHSYTVGSQQTDGPRWLVWVERSRWPGSNGRLVAVAFPTTTIDESLSSLALNEAIAGAILLLLVGAGTWLAIRRGLGPLAKVTSAAEAVSAGDLSVRVPPASGELGQLGEAFNTMAGDLQTAFAARTATEDRLRQFLADAAHELRTPLTSIRGFAEMFRLGGADHSGPDTQTIARRIEQESARMATLVDDLLLLARLDQTRPFERADVDLAVLAADACTDAVAQDRSRSVSLDASSPVVVSGDQAQLRQAVGNLVANAVKHTPPGTPIEVAVTLDGDRGVVTVRDHGFGLGPAALEHAFDRFWQADAARAGAGSGLGLSIVAGIAQAHGGKVEASNRPDGGAEFTLTVPRRAV